MPRLYSKNACSACRRRRKKCGEEKPSCSACIRLDLPCTYPTKEDEVATATKNNLQMALLDSVITTMPRIERFASLAPEAVHIGDFHRLPITDKQRVEVVGLCEHLVRSLMRDVWPFALPKTQSKVVSDGWLVPTFSLGRMTLVSCAAIAAGLQARGETSSPWQLVRSRYQAEALALLRADLDATMKASAGGPPEFTTLVCAAHIPIVAISYTISGTLLEKFASGARTLLKQVGGLRVFIDMGQHHVVQIFVRAEYITCMVTGKPSEYLLECDRPVTPPAIVHQTLELHPAFAKLCDPTLLEVIEDFRLLLHYRVSKEQANTCHSLEEFYYLTDLFHHLDLQLTHLQAQYRDSKTVQECIVYTLILLRIDVLGERWLHPKLGDLVCTRYFQAVDQIDIALWIRNSAMDILMWVLCVGTILCHAADMRKRCSDKLAIVLPHALPPQTRGTDFNLREEVETVMWTTVWHAQMSQSLASALPIWKDSSDSSETNGHNNQGSKKIDG